MKLKTCKTCGKNYRPKSNRQRNCTKCGRRGGSTACEVCDKKFKIVAHTTGRFCSVKCYRKSAQVARMRECEICRTQFDPGPGRLYQPQKTCSVACADALKTKERPKCKTCGAPVKQLKHKYCSRACAMTGQVRRGQRSRHPDGFRFRHQAGYIQVKVDGAWVFEHRHVMSVKLGRPLAPRERVHHLNGIRNDNRPENLELWTLDHKDPPGVRASDMRRDSSWVNGVMSL